MLYLKKEVTVCGKKREIEEPDLKDIGRWLGACLTSFNDISWADHMILRATVTTLVKQGLIDIKILTDELEKSKKLLADIGQASPISIIEEFISSLSHDHE